MALAVLASVLVLFCVCVCVSVCSADYYTALGVPRSASEREIKQAYHQLAKNLHPDRNPSPDAQHAFTQLTQAYEVLSNRASRRIYNQISEQDFPEDSSDVLTFELHELLNIIRLEDDFYGDLGHGWSFNVWDITHDDGVDDYYLGDKFSIL